VAKEGGYSAAGSGADSVLWCLDFDGTKGVLRLVNNRRYPLLVSPHGLDVAQRDQGGTFAQDIARRLSKQTNEQATVIYPRDEAAFGAELPLGRDVDLEVTVGQQAQLLSSLDVGLKVWFAIVTKFGASDDPTLELKAMDRLLTSNACINSKNTGKMIANCLSAKRIIDAVGGVWGVILAPIVTVAGVVDYFHGAVNGFMDQFDGRTYAHVVMKRTAPPFSTFVGAWHVHGAQLTVNANYAGAESSNAGTCLNDLSSTLMCEGHARLMCEGHASLVLESNAEGVGVTISRVWYTTWAGDPPPPGFDPGTDIPTAGDTSELTWVAHALLKERLIKSQLSQLDKQYGNPYWCGPGISQANVSKCGA